MITRSLSAVPQRVGRARILAVAAVAGALFVTATPGLAAPAAPYNRPGGLVEVDVTSGGQPPSTSGNYASSSISADGEFVAFSSTAQLTQGAQAGTLNVYVRDVQTGRTVLVSRGLNGLPAMAPPTPSLLGVQSADPSISADGRYVAFDSDAVNLVPGQTTVGQRNVYLFDRETDQLRLVSVGLHGAPAVGQSGSKYPSVDGDGNLVSFSSDATNLVNGQSSIPGVFVRNMRTGQVSRVDVSSSGQQADYCTPTALPPQLPPLPTVCSGSGAIGGVAGFIETGGTLPESSISANGCCVAFDSPAANLVAGDTNRQWDVFVHFLKGGTTVRVSVASDGAQAITTCPDVPSFPTTPDPAAGSTLTGDWGGNAAPGHAMSADGRYVVFVSYASNLVPNKQNCWNTPYGQDVYVHDLRTGRTYRVSVGPDGREINYQHLGSYSEYPSISPDGRFVTFFNGGEIEGQYPGYAENSPCPYGNCNDGSTVFVYDRETGQLDVEVPFPTNRARYAWCGQCLSGAGSPDISSDGSYVSLVGDWGGPNATNGVDVFRWTHGPTLAVGGLAALGRLVVTGATGFAWTGFVSGVGSTRRNDKVPTAPAAELVGASLAYRPAYQDLFLRLDLAGMPLFPLASEAVVYGMDLTVNGVCFQARAAKTGPMAASFGLFRQGTAGLWTQVASLPGGYGTTGDEVVFTLPLTDIGAQSGGRLSGLNAFTGIGSYLTGAAKVLDTIALSR